MLAPDPVRRISASTALERLRAAMGTNEEVARDAALAEEVAREEAYFETVLESLESCPVVLDPENAPRPLHFLASFMKGTPVGLQLAEASEVEDDGSMGDDDWERWQQATQYAYPGEVFVRGWEGDSQASRVGIFEVGDRLRGVGELPFVGGGFEQAIKLVRDGRFAYLMVVTTPCHLTHYSAYRLQIKKQPKGGSLKLRFDRIPRPKISSNQDQIDGSREIKVTDQGAWKSAGRRGNQEDSFGEEASSLCCVRRQANCSAQVESDGPALRTTAYCHLVAGHRSTLLTSNCVSPIVLRVLGAGIKQRVRSTLSNPPNTFLHAPL